MVSYSESRRRAAFQFINKHHENCPVEKVLQRIILCIFDRGIFPKLASIE